MFEHDKLPAEPMRLPPMSIAELAAFCDLLNGTLFGRDWTAQNLVLEIDDGEEYFGTVSRWGVDPVALARRVSKWSRAQILGALAFVHIFWRGPDRPDGETIRNGFLRAAGKLLPSAHARSDFRRVLDRVDAELGHGSFLQEVPIPASVHVPQVTIQARAAGFGRALVPMFAGRVAGGPSRDMRPSRIALDEPAPSLMHGEGPDG